MEKCLGRHLLIDCKNVPKDICLDDGLFLKTMSQAAELAGATVVSQIRYHFGHNSPPGFACLVMLDESHISAHCYADLGVIAMDVFTCGNTNPEDVFSHIRENLGIEDYSLKFIERFVLGDENSN
jgi:S-adenosylmethionine decarboxylase